MPQVWGPDYGYPAQYYDLTQAEIDAATKTVTSTSLVTSPIIGDFGGDFLPGDMGGAGGLIPDFGGLGGLAGGLLGGLLGGVVGGGTGGFLPAPDLFPDCGPDLVYDPATGSCKLVVGGTTMAGRVVYDNCGRCFIERNLPARTVRRKGRMVCGPNGQMACRPAARRMNALNPRALNRALRRAKAFAKFARKAVRIQQTFKKGGAPRVSRKKKTCSA